ncbi:OsmC family peroxiredoxin [Segetibacter sp. 3557_3]|uniref:OsmC family protein n=1 Tax=Segetibacter sp. 3557_3 TaxID=2547429 RepID=UPI0010590FD0|nr:OsmC family protein [Segetibacter sp. 3557_3]TDH25652.1 OsmC family peroxiredoxin [Segetibacter sp. 3557_3]
MVTISINRVEGDFGFEASDTNGHVVRLDTSAETGGNNYGARPMQAVLMALGGCSGIDVVSILKKQRQVIEGFAMRIEGEREKGKEPALWETVNIDFELSGNIDEDKAYRACALSIDKYCSVAETLRRGGTKITWKVQVNKP